MEAQHLGDLTTVLSAKRLILKRKQMCRHGATRDKYSVTGRAVGTKGTQQGHLKWTHL